LIEQETLVERRGLLRQQWGAQAGLHGARPGGLRHDRDPHLAPRRGHGSDAPTPPAAAAGGGRPGALAGRAGFLIALAIPDLLEALTERVAENEPRIVPRHPR